MKDLDIRITKEGIALLKGLIGQEFISMKHEKMDEYHDVFGRVIIKTSNGRYLVNNHAEWFDEYFGGLDAIPHLNFQALKEGENPLGYANEEDLSTEEVGETIADVQIIRDRADVLDGTTHWQYMDTSEGIIIVTENAQYGFFKENIWFDETMLMYMDGKVLSKIPDLQSHWDIFGYPYNAKVERFLLSLKTWVEQKLGEAEERGEAGKEEANS